MVTFRVLDMTCGHCASTIARAVVGVDKAARIDVDVPAKLVTVRSAASAGELAEAIQEAGYTTQQVKGLPGPAPAASGCCCASRQEAAVDARQAGAAAGGACCG